MSPSDAYYIRLRTATGQLEPVLLEMAAPLLQEFGGNPLLESAYFARYRTEALLFVLGERDFLEASIRPRIERDAAACRARGSVESWTCPDYVPETDRYGGEEGLRLAGRIFQADSRACLRAIDADLRGRVPRSRREWSLVLTERFLGLLGFGSRQRTAFYRRSYAWTTEQEIWNAGDFRLLEDRYQGLKEGITSLLRAGGWDDPDSAEWGEEAALAARDWLEETRPLVDRLLRAHADGVIRQDLVELAWSYTHMHCIRLGIPGNGEAILRYLMHRLYEDGFGSDA